MVNLEECIGMANASNAQTYMTGVNSDQQSQLKIRQCISVGDRCMLLVSQQQPSQPSPSSDSCEVLVWGSNDKGQLGLGTYEDEFSPKRLDFFSKAGLRVQMLAGGGEISLAACENGEAYAWPFQRGHTTYSLPVKMPFSDKVKIARVSCGNNFGFFNSKEGLVYAVGKDNAEG